MPWCSSAICSRPSSSTRWSGAARASTKKRRSTSSGSTTTPMSPACSARSSSPSRRDLVAEARVVVKGRRWRRKRRRPGRGRDRRAACRRQPAGPVHPHLPRGPRHADSGGRIPSRGDPARLVRSAQPRRIPRSSGSKHRSAASLIDHLLGDNFSPEVIREIDQMTDFDLYDFFGHHGYHARALKRPERGALYISGNQPWFADMDAKAAIVLKGLGHQFAAGRHRCAGNAGTVGSAGDQAGRWAGCAARARQTNGQVMHEAKARLFGV
jgi:hypothetical protein